MLQTLQRLAGSHLRPQHAQYDADFDPEAEVFWTEDMLAKAETAGKTVASQPVQSYDPIPLHRQPAPRPVFGRRGL